MYRLDEYNRRGLNGWEKEFIDQYLVGRHRVLIVGAGGGREVAALQRLGFVVDGFECHPQLQEYANTFLLREGLSPAVSLMPRDECPNEGRTYDGFIVGWGAYMLIQGRRRRITFLKTMRQLATLDAPILLSFFPRTRDSRYLKTVYYIGNCCRSLLFRSLIELGDDLDPNYVHRFSEEEAAAELREAGFEMQSFATKGYGRAIGVAVT